MSNVIQFDKCLECSRIKTENDPEKLDSKYIYCVKCLKKIVINNIERVINELTKDNEIFAMQWQLYKPLFDKYFVENKNV